MITNKDIKDAAKAVVEEINMKETNKKEADVEWEELEGTQDPIWQPQKTEDELTGVVVSKELNDNYGYRWLVKTATDEDLFTPFHKVLQDRMLDVVEGDVVKIIFKGSEPSGKGNPVNIYKVYKAKVN